MRLILISGDGHGAGKTFLARRLARDQCIFSVANMIRLELRKQYPGYDWYNKDPKVKSATLVKETQKSMHQMLDELGRAKKSKNPLVWVQMIKELIEYSRDHSKLELAVVDDVRFVDECNYLKTLSGLDSVTHLHVINPHSKPEPNYENEKLKESADFKISRD